MKRFILREWQPTDAADLSENISNKKIWDRCRDCLPYPYTENDASAFISYAAKDARQKNYCIEIDGKAAGNVSFERGTDVERFNAEAGYWLAEKHWNNGIMTAAIRLAISKYLSVNSVRRICAKVFGNNPASMRVLEKAGFTQCGVHHKACFKNGQFIDCVHYELLRENVSSTDT